MNTRCLLLLEEYADVLLLSCLPRGLVQRKPFWEASFVVGITTSRTTSRLRTPLCERGGATHFLRLLRSTLPSRGT